jgi:hypothetical protein
MLLLGSVDLTSADAERKWTLWQFVVDLSLEEGADRYAIDAARDKRASSPKGTSALSTLLKSAPTEYGLRPIGDLAPVLVDAGLDVVSINLYAQSAWISGISDWGSSLSVLFDMDTWQRLRTALDSSASAPLPYEVAEALSRPRLG